MNLMLLLASVGRLEVSWCHLVQTGSKMIWFVHFKYDTQKVPPIAFQAFWKGLSSPDPSMSALLDGYVD